MLWIRKQEPGSDYEVYGVQPDTEQVPKWKTFKILMMNSHGKHKMTKSCVLEYETVIILILEWLFSLWNGRT